MPTYIGTFGILFVEKVKYTIKSVQNLIQQMEKVNCFSYWGEGYMGFSSWTSLGWTQFDVSRIHSMLCSRRCVLQCRHEWWWW